MGRCITLFLNKISKLSSINRCFKVDSLGCLHYRNNINRNLHWTRMCYVTNEKLSAPDIERFKSNFVEEPIPHDVLIQKLQNCLSLDDQMRTLYTILHLTPEDIAQRHTVAQQIEEMLSPFLHNFDIKIFGSSVNGFGFKGCDIDMVLTAKVDSKNVRASVFDDSNIPSLEDILNGKVSKEYMDFLSPRDQLIFIHTVFLDFYRDSTAAPVFINAHIPIIRFLHDRFKLKVDFTCSNDVGIINSKLLYAFGQIDDRVTPFIMTIRYWAKHAGLIGGGLMFNSYCLTLLAIYFMQTRNPPILPTVQYLKSVVGEDLNSLDLSEEVCSIVADAIPRTKNTQNLGELLREFFFYYFHFDFTHVICPLNANCLPREAFAHGEESKKFKFNTICVQDPIKLTHNVANLVDFKHCKKFAIEMLSICKLFQDKSYLIPSSNPWGLTALFNRPIEIPHFYTYEQNAEFTISCCPVSSKNLLKTSKTIVEIFTDVLLFKCNDVQTVECFKDEENLLLKFKCFVQRNTWLGRSTVEVNVDSSDPLIAERAISLSLVQKKKPDERDNSFCFFCSLYAVTCDGEPSLLVKMQSVTKKGLNPILPVFLKEYLPEVLKKLH